MIAVTATSLREKLNHYLDRAARSFEVIVVSRNNEEDDSVVIMSLKEYNALTETDRLLSTSANRKRLSESISQVKKGKTIAPKEFNR